jgi:hypothetical protein
VRTISTISKQIKKGAFKCDNNDLLDLIDWKRKSDEKFFGSSDTYSKMEVWDEYISMS